MVLAQAAKSKAATLGRRQRNLRAFRDRLRKRQFSNEVEAVKVLDRVALMTPENIHVNSFMYEPIIDMSDDYLRKLCVDVTKLA